MVIIMAREKTSFLYHKRSRGSWPVPVLRRFREIFSCPAALSNSGGFERESMQAPELWRCVR